MSMEPQITTAAPRNAWIRAAALAVLLTAIGAAAYGLFGTARGQELIENREKVGADVRQWVGRHRVEAPAAYIAVFTIATLLALPVWWLQVLAGYGFALYLGTFYSQI